ncbi:MAG: TonB-dependent receptor [Acidobacteria bacterium]|nr:TonB-dependent receptor [Acidobacteriota bacterium]
MQKSSLIFPLALGALLLGFAPSLLAQGEGAVHGLVIAKADGSPLSNVKVSLEGPTLIEPIQTETGEDGHFGFQHLAPGSYSLVAEREDFLEERVRFTIKPRDVQNITLGLSLRPLTEKIEVTAELVSVLSIHSPSSTTLEEQRIAAIPLPLRNNIPDMIVTTAPGMVRSHDDFVHVRGSEIALNTFINGVSFWENPHSMFSPGLSPDLIQSVNVMTGGFPAEYGNHFGGVLDVVTKSGFSMDNRGALTLGAGSVLHHNAGVEYGGHTQKVAYYLFTSGFESARFLSPPDPRSIHNTGRGMRNFLQLDFNINSENYLKLVFLGDGTNFEIPKTPQDDELRPNANASQRNRSQSAIFTWSHVISKDTLLDTSFYQRWSHSLLLPAVDPLAATARSERALHTTGIKSDLVRFFGRHTIKGGMDAVLLKPDEELFYDHTGYMRLTRLLHLSHVHIRTIDFARQKTGGQLSLYLQDKMQLTDQLTLDAGLRYDRYSLAVSDFHFSPRLNLAYRFSPAGAVLHASYNHFFVPPAVENVLASSAGLTGLIPRIGAALPPLRPVIENQFELGVTQPFRGRLQLGLTGYYRSSNKPLHTILLPDSRIYAYANFDRGKAYGLEIRMELPTVARLGVSGYLNYALARVYLYNPVTAGLVSEPDLVTATGKFLAPMDQTHTVNAGFTYRPARSRVWSSMTFEYGGGTPVGAHAHGGESMGQAMGAATPTRVPPHFTQNLSIGMDLLRNGDRPRLGLQFNIENLTDNVYKVAQESVFSPGQFSIPRLFSGSVKLHF